MPDWKQCVMSLVGVWCTVFPHGLPARWFLQATCEPGPLQAAKTRVSSTFFSTTEFCLPRMDPKEREKHCRLICWCISKNLCRFYSIIYASVVCIKDGSNYTPSRCVCLHRKKKKLKKMQRWELTVSSSMIQLQSSTVKNLGLLHLYQPEGTLSLPMLIFTINTKTWRSPVSFSLASSASNLQRAS